MTELNSAPSIPENDKIEPAPSSVRVMLISMLLLICALSLSSAMLIYYAPDGNTDQAAADFGAFRHIKKFIPARSWPAGEQGLQPTKRTSTNIQSAPVQWPDLKLTGFGKAIDGHGGFAIINGKHVLLNAPIKQAILVEIQARGVVLEYKGEQKTLVINHP